LNDSAAKPVKILLVDDSPTIRAATREMLQKMGHTVSMAENGEQALASYQSDRPDLILLDVMMPVMDGHATAQNIRSRYPKDTVPIIFLSGVDDQKRLALGIQAGGNDYLIKPVSDAALSEKITRYAAPK
jgi:CheY-like chemotaxis protein